MRNKYLHLALTIFAIFIFLILNGCSKEEIIWKKANSKNTIVAYREYLSKYPAGKYAEEAKNRILQMKLEEGNVVRVIVKQSYEKAHPSEVNLPFYEYTKKIFGDYYDFWVVEEDAKKYNATLTIESRGIPDKATYLWTSGSGAGLKGLWTIARIEGTISFEKDGETREWSFDYKEGPREETFGSEKTPDKAPFLDAFYNGFLPVLFKVIFEVKDKDIKPLILALVDKDIFLHSAAVKALDNINPAWRETEDAQRAVPDFINTLKDKDLEARRIAAWALGEIKNRQAIEPLILALKDENVRWDSAEALKKITGEDFGTEYDKWKNWWKDNKGKVK